MTSLPPDLSLLERWLLGWSLSRGYALPVRSDEELSVEVGEPEQLRRHVFAKLGPALSARAEQIHERHVFLKVAVSTDALRAALPARWTINRPGYLMHGPAEFLNKPSLPGGYSVVHDTIHAAQRVTLLDEAGVVAARGRIVFQDYTAVFDTIETHEAHRRKGLASYVMHALNQMANARAIHERLLVATPEGQMLYQSLGWQLLAPYSTAELA